MIAWLTARLHWFGAPANYYRFAGPLAWLASVGGLALFALGAYAGLALAPPDYQHGESFRIIYVHVPAAWLSLMIYSLMAMCAVVALVWRIRICERLLRAAAPIGAAATFMALLTGSIWGKPAWGAWWVWGDARLTSELILLFIYLAIIGLARAGGEGRASARASALLTVVGVVILPIIHYSVHWWSSLHQAESVQIAGKIAIEWQMLWPLLAMALAYTLLFVGLWQLRIRAALLRAHPGLR